MTIQNFWTDSAVHLFTTWILVPSSHEMESRFSLSQNGGVDVINNGLNTPKLLSSIFARFVIDSDSDFWEQRSLYHQIEGQYLLAYKPVHN